jgi:hypothetical protein
VGGQLDARANGGAVGASVTIAARVAGALVKSIDKNVRTALLRGGIAGAHRGRAIIVRRTPTDLGQLKASWKVRQPVVSADAKLQTISELKNDAPHVMVVELGARPHAVNPQGWSAIYEWVRRHPELYTGSGKKSDPTWQGPNVPKMRRTKKLRAAGPLRPFQGPDPELTAITNAIVWKIRKHGQKPTYFIRNSIPDLENALRIEIDRALAKAQERIDKGLR